MKNINYNSECDDFEEWEGDAYLFEKEDWVALLNLRQEKAIKRPSDLFAQQRYGQALVLNRKFKEAIDFLTPLYRENFGSGFGITEIIDALFGLGKTENDFVWIEKPTVLKLDKITLNLCIEILSGKRKHTSIIDLHLKLMLNSDYLTFNENELKDFLIKYADIFDFKGDARDFWDIEIKLKKERKL